MYTATPITYKAFDNFKLLIASHGKIKLYFTLLESIYLGKKESSLHSYNDIPGFREVGDISNIEKGH